MPFLAFLFKWNVEILAFEKKKNQPYWRASSFKRLSSILYV